MNPRNGGDSGPKPVFSLIIPVLHEAELINDLLTDIENRLGSFDPEIVVVDGSEEADTLGSIKRERILKVKSKAHRGHQMNLGARISRGRILVFLHADTILPDGALQAIHGALQDGFKAGAFTVTFFGSDSFLLKTLAWGHTLRSRITRIPYGDQVHFFDSDYFHSIGGYSEDLLMEDAEIMNRIKRRGDPIAILPLEVRTSARRFQENGMLRSLIRYSYLRTLDRLGASRERW